MKISLVLNGKNVEALISDDRLLIDFLRDHGCLSVKRGCESSNCGLCTVFMDVEIRHCLCQIFIL